MWGNYTKLGGAVLAGAIIAFVAAYWVLDPVARLDQSQKVILDQYLALYCNPPPPVSDERKIFVSGQLALASKLTIAAGIGELALIEYGKCKLEIVTHG